MSKSNEEGWPKAPKRIAEREESSQKLRAARKSLAHILVDDEENDNTPTERHIKVAKPYNDR